MHRLKRAVTTLLCSLALSAPMLLPAQSLALFENAKDQACAGANLNDTGCDPTDSKKKISDTLATIINILSLIVGIISVIMIIIGGIRFATSQGDGNSTAAARNTIIYAVVGLVVALLAQFIVKFVVGRVAT